MTWNFRFVKHSKSTSRDAWYGVHEVFYHDAGKPWAITQDPIQVEGESAKDIVAFLNLMKRDLQRLPVLDISTTKWARPPSGMGRAKQFTDVKALMNDLRSSP